MTHIEDRWVIRARELADAPKPFSESDLDISAALVLGQEMADARAEYIALKIDQRVNRSECIRNAYDEAITCAEIARSTVEKPQTREAAMEKAVTGLIAALAGQIVSREVGDALAAASRALHWKPHTERTPRPD